MTNKKKTTKRLRHYTAEHTDTGVHHLSCGGKIKVDKIGEEKRIKKIGMGYKWGIFKAKQAYSWHRTYQGSCEKCKKAGLFTIEEPHRRTLKTTKL